MKIRFLGAFCTALMLAAPAYAQSHYVLVIGEMPSARVQAPRAPIDQARQIEIAAERACERPRLTNLVGQRLYRECLNEARAEAAMLFEQRAARSQIASR